MSDREYTEAQLRVCDLYGVNPRPVDPSLRVGVAKNIDTGLWPINGLRHNPQGDTDGWYIWAGGEPSSAPDFFQPLHVRHLRDRCPMVLPYLVLPPGWRFLIAPGHEDVWEDPTLLLP